MFRKFLILQNKRLLASQSWEFINPYPTNKSNPEYGAPEIPIPPPLNRTGESIVAKKRRLVYSSRKRGILETDLLLSTFIDKEIDKMTELELFQYDKLLNENDWDIYYWTTGAKNPPEFVLKMSFWPRLVLHCENKERKGLRMPDLK